MASRSIRRPPSPERRARRIHEKSDLRVAFFRLAAAEAGRSARRLAVARGHPGQRRLQRRRFEAVGQFAQRGRARRRHACLLDVRWLGRRLRTHANPERRHRPAALLEIREQPRLDLPQPRGQRVVRGKQGQDAFLDEARLDVIGQVIGEQRGQVALQRGDLLDAGTQRGERVGASEHLGRGLRPGWAERAVTLGESVHRGNLRARLARRYQRQLYPGAARVPRFPAGSPGAARAGLAADVSGARWLAC
ncbi:protein of unknown function [Burkholderia multivorans]